MSQLHGSNSYIKLDEVIQYIHKNLDKRITVIELSERMCLTPDHFSKVFKKIIGVPPCEYIQMKRIERAQAMLISSKLNIMQIAECVGIYNPAQFTRLFSKLTQCSPREYRAKQLNDITYLRKKDSASHASGSES
jgi:AraC-like DNA-binding protein